MVYGRVLYIVYIVENIKELNSKKFEIETL